MAAGSEASYIFFKHEASAPDRAMRLGELLPKDRYVRIRLPAMFVSN
jgi:hypothetical protein